MLAMTPPMGWNSWNTFGPQIDEQLIIETADAIVDEGLRDAGYQYIVVDDVWEAATRVDGRLAADPDRFPSGIGALAGEIHRRGLRFGLYSCAGTHTCEQMPGSYGHESVDAATFAEWGVDYLKYDFCHTPAGADPVALYRRMGQALRQTGRSIVYSVCEWGQNQPWTWGAGVGAHLWRTTPDIVDTWDSIVEIGFDRQAGLEPYAGPGRWNDPDMLVVGMYGRGHVGRGGCTDAEYRSHFTLWALLAAPLMIGCDVRSMSDSTRSILGNRGLLAANQDGMGAQGRRVGSSRHGTRTEVWAKPLGDGSIAVGMFNLDDGQPRLVQVGWEALGLDPDRSCRVVDLWHGAEVGIHRVALSATVAPHDAEAFRITPEA